MGYETPEPAHNERDITNQKAPWVGSFAAGKTAIHGTLRPSSRP